MKAHSNNLVLKNDYCVGDIGYSFHEYPYPYYDESSTDRVKFFT